MAHAAQSLHIAAGNYVKEAALEFVLHGAHTALQSLSYGTVCTYYALRLENRGYSIHSLISSTVSEVNSQFDYWTGRGFRKALIHSRSQESALSQLGALGGSDDDSGLFWRGYLHAEHWDNVEALSVFKRLALRCPSASVLHWTGNILSKLGRFEEALPFLERASEMEPSRYNHHSHLANVYRGLRRPGEAAASYRRAIALIRERNIGRVEHIHLVRCYHGLARLGHAACQDLERGQQAAALSSGSVTEDELERIKF